MNRLLLLLFVAVVTFGLVMLAFKPDFMSDIWVWVIGFVGAIAAIGKKGLSKVKGLIDEKKKQKLKEDILIEDRNRNIFLAAKQAGISIVKTSSSPGNVNGLENIVSTRPKDTFAGTTVTLLRYTKDTDSTIGLLFINGKYFCYTLEDAFNPIKISGKTRIPSGTYHLNFLKEMTPLTETYRNRFPDWFSYHIHVEDVPGFTKIYIHNGGTHADTAGCILVSDSLTDSQSAETFTNSRETYKRLYTYLGQELAQENEVRLAIRDETWFYEQYI